MGIRCGATRRLTGSRSNSARHGRSSMATETRSPDVSVEGATTSATGAAPDLLHLNLGPQHPSTHGVLRLSLDLDGEVVAKCQPIIGYLHTGIEKTFEQKTYLQGFTLTDRMDYLNPLGNNLAYSLSVEKLFNCEIPPRATVMRVLLAELTRLNSHLVWLGTSGLDLGASSVLMYCFREREQLLDFFEELSGQRMMTSWIRPGGLTADAPEGWLERVDAFMAVLPDRIDDYEALLTANPMFKDRMIGVGPITAQQCHAWGVTGPILRA